jgi:hypothetical protein
MSLEAKGFRHVAVAVSTIPMCGPIAAHTGQQGTQPQQPDLVHNEPLIGRHCRQPLNGGGAIMCGITPSA